MINKILIWLDDKFYLRENVGEILDPELIDGILIANRSNAIHEFEVNKKDYPLSLHSIGTGERHWYDLYPNMQKYIGEPQSVYDYYFPDKLCWETMNVEKNLYRFGDKVLVDEPDPRLLDNLKDYRCHVSFSSYRRIWFRIPLPKFLKKIFKVDCLRVYIPFSNQLSHWIEINSKFGLRFSAVWIHLERNKNDFEELIGWALKHKKRIMIYAVDMEFNLIVERLKKVRECLCQKK